MTTLDDAFVTAVIAFRPSSLAPEASRPRAALVIRFPGDSAMPEDALREAVMRAMLRQGWQLVAAPVGMFEWADSGRQTPRVNVTDGDVRVEIAGETLYEGPLGLTLDVAGFSWLALARAVEEMPVFVTVGSTPIVTEADLDAAARAGRLVGLPGRSKVAP